MSASPAYSAYQPKPAWIIAALVAYWLLGQTNAWLPAWLEKSLGFGGVVAGRWLHPGRSLRTLNREAAPLAA
ncbi:hypothetical protein [Paraburkholderia sacchari]|uniref:hypothetical protein n=1 Tax=Paraburkholderia sacchari TaxID=159450 RepID=UPI0039A4A02C